MIGEIVGDALRYPLSDLKKVILYGLIGLFTTTAVFRAFFALNGLTNVPLIAGLILIELLVSIIFTGYFLRIIKSTLFGTQKLPEFNSGREMFTDGVKVFLVGIVYIVPIILIVTIFAVMSSSALEIIAHQIVVNGFNLENVIEVLIGLGAGTGVLIAVIYLIIILPVFMVAITNMGKNKSELKAAFRFYEIFNKISAVGWVSFIIWYIVTGTIFLIILGAIGTLIIAIFSLINNITVGGLLISVVLIPYLYMYFARSSALLYMSK